MRRAAPVPRRAPGSGIGLLVALSALALVCDTAAAQDPKKAETPTDADLLEFLGSVDSEADSQAADDGSWIDYLAQTDIGKVAKAADPNDAASKQSATGAQPPASGDKKND
jgi:hypothetical protein